MRTDLATKRRPWRFGPKEGERPRWWHLLTLWLSVTPFPSNMLFALAFGGALGSWWSQTPVEGFVLLAVVAFAAFYYVITVGFHWRTYRRFMRGLPNALDGVAAQRQASEPPR